MGGGHLLPTRALELGTECLQQLFCHHCSKHIPACACLAKVSIFMALLLADNQAKAVKQEFRERNFESLRPPPAAWPVCDVGQREQAVCKQEHSSSKVTEV